MPKRVRKYEESLLASLRDPVEAAEYLNAHLEPDGTDADELFLLALRDVAKAHGMTQVAAKAKVGRESLYKTLSAKGNPKLSTLSTVLDAMGLKLSVAPEKRRRRSA